MHLPATIVLAAVVVTVGAVGAVGAAQDDGGDPEGDWPPRQRFRISRAGSAVEVDGRLDEGAWSGATVIPLTHEWSPGDNVEPPVETECLVTFDSEALYVAFRASDPDPGAIRAYLADRDTAFEDDAVGFFIDTFNDRRRALHFRVNPLGVQLDATVSDVEDSEDFSWDAIWASEGRITDDGYVVEIAVPWEQLRFPRSHSEQTWGFLALRNYPRSVFHEIRSTYNDRDLDCLVCQFDTVEGFVGMDPGYNLEVVPTTTAQGSEERPGLDAPFETSEESVEAGVTARWGVTPNISLGATVNPDFSQVEADAAQLDVNERFALFFPEKRPFFLEGADLFTTPLDVVFTRTVADPAAGVKLTGKEGRHAFGLFTALDQRNNLIFPGAESSSFTSEREDVASGVLRYRRDMGTTSTLGVLYTGRQATDYHNHVLGVDGTVRITDSDTVRFQALGSDTEYPAAFVERFDQPVGSFQDAAWQVDYARSTREWLWLAGASSLGEDFRADSGFLPQVDVRRAFGVVQRIFWSEPDDWYSRFLAQLDYTHRETQSGQHLEDSVNITLTYEGPLQSRVQVGIRPNRESFRGETFDDLRGDVRIQMRPRGSLGLELFVRGGETIDFVNVRQARFFLVQPRVDFRLGRRFSGELEYLWQELEVPGGDRFLEAQLAQSTLVYHLNVRSFVRAIFQYQEVTRDPDLFLVDAPVEPREEELFTQLLFSYKVNPETVLFFGYSDFHQGFDEVSLTQSRRTLFLKIGYAFLW